jgi:hypothetical protein
MLQPVTNMPLSSIQTTLVDDSFTCNKEKITLILINSYENIVKVFIFGTGITKMSKR